MRIELLSVVLACAIAFAQMDQSRVDSDASHAETPTPGQNSNVILFSPTRDCAKTPALIRDAAKVSGVEFRRICYVSDRAAFASKAGESFAHDLDRIGKLVRVVIPFGHLLIINGTEYAVQMAIRRYDVEQERRLAAARLTARGFFGTPADQATKTLDALTTLRKFYANEIAEAAARIRTAASPEILKNRTVVR